uniref:Secreted protein n=1 Tax=Arundo donax TaxID=35708 RepID=A0A0A9GST7_ARUDO
MLFGALWLAAASCRCILAAAPCRCILAAAPCRCILWNSEGNYNYHRYPWINR